MNEMQKKELRAPENAVLYSVSEVAALLHVNTGYVHRLRRAGLIPFFRLGSYKCRRGALEEFLIRCDGQDVDEMLRGIEAQTAAGAALQSVSL